MGLNWRSFLERLADLGYAFSDDDFVNWGRAGRTFPRDWAALHAIVQVLTRDQPPSRRCTAGEALQVLALVGMPFAELHALAALFSAAEFSAALTTYIPTIPGETLVQTDRHVAPLDDVGLRVSDRTPSEVKSSEVAGSGLLALTELMQIPAVHDAVVSFRTAFQTACEQIGSMAHYKHLHELFQQLEDRYYLLYHDGKRLPGDPSAWSSIERNEPELQAAIADLLDLAQRAPLAIDTALFQHRLARAGEDLQVAIEQRELARLRQATTHLREVLGREPSRVNTRLVSTASALHLAALVRALATVRDHLTRLSFDQAALRHVEAFARGVDVLAELDDRLTGAITAHNTFQELDDELRRIEALLDQDMSELEHARQTLKLLMQRLCGDPRPAGQPSSARSEPNWNTTWRPGTSTRPCVCFGSYRSQAIRSFNQVDRICSCCVTSCRRWAIPGNRAEDGRMSIFGRAGIIHEGLVGFLSLAELKAAHTAILDRRRLLGDTPEVLGEVDTFIRRGCATGRVLDVDEQRWAAQSVLDYWANVLYRLGS